MSTLVTEEYRVKLLAHGLTRPTWQECDLAAGRARSDRWRYGLRAEDRGFGMSVLGTVKLSDLASIIGPHKQPVMRDRYFQPTRPLSEYVRLAQENGWITD